ncbi:MAG: DNA-3-methyladenine glycosylase 2 family protein [Candidatus Puniceispirillum sp. TMED245]|jgi:DNA-3-methyladenine glycosylase II|nr:MAG: DNA-3-methyladenine glycosylase 2 family protein [Candidatus Puniceispirillum sp. TMED245]
MTDMQHKLHIDAGGGEGGALVALAGLDADIAGALDRYGPPPDRSLPASFETLARAIVGQQVSRAAASSIWTRMEAGGVTAIGGVLAASIDELMAVGLSRRKAEYLTGIAEEISSGRLNIEDLQEMGGEEVQKRLVAIRGVGAWTADNFRLFALADMDAWPVKDVALQEAMKILKSLQTRPTAEDMEDLGNAWRPFRGAGALVLWHLYAIEVRKVTVADI